MPPPPPLEEGLLLGLNKALDVRLMRTNVHAAESAMESARRTRDAARRALETLLGRYPKSTLVAAAALPTLDQPAPTGLPSQLLDRRPDLVAARKTFHAAHRRVAADDHGGDRRHHCGLSSLGHDVERG